MPQGTYDAGGAGLGELGTVEHERRSGMPSRPLFGRLPLKRVIPQDLHSVLDYTGGLTLGAAGLMADSQAARVTGTVLSAAVIGASAVTDYRLSLAKLIPIEVHEVLDYLAGFAAVAAPFALGYHRRDPLAATLHAVVGATMIVGSLFTDYRAQRGRGRRRAATFS